MSSNVVSLRQTSSGAPRSTFEAIASSLISAERSLEERQRLHALYDSATPYPHLVVDGLFDDVVLDRVLAEFPKPGQRDWIAWDTTEELKQTSRSIFDLSPFTQMLLLQLCSEPFVRFMRDVTGYQDLVPDPLFHGGGLHESFRGGWLNIHADYTKHPALPLVRRVNLIVYLNHEWDPAWNGDIELWDSWTERCGAKVAPLFNRSLIFPTTNEALHGFPEPIACPDDRSRKSISLFYWSADGEAVKAGAPINFMRGRKETRVKAFARSCVPPIVYRELHHGRTAVRHGLRDLRRRIKAE